VAAAEEEEEDREGLIEEAEDGVVLGGKEGEWAL